MKLDKFKNSDRLFELIPELKECKDNYKKINCGYFFVIIPLYQTILNTIWPGIVDLAL